MIDNKSIQYFKCLLFKSYSSLIAVVLFIKPNKIENCSPRSENLKISPSF